MRNAFIILTNQWYKILWRIEQDNDLTSLTNNLLETSPFVSARFVSRLICMLLSLTLLVLGETICEAKYGHCVQKSSLLLRHPRKSKTSHRELRLHCWFRFGQDAPPPHTHTHRKCSWLCTSWSTVDRGDFVCVTCRSLHLWGHLSLCIFKKCITTASYNCWRISCDVPLLQQFK